MPRERRPRQAAIGRATNQSTYGSRPARVTRAATRRAQSSPNSNSTVTSASSASSTSSASPASAVLEFSQLFPSFHSQNEDVLMVDGRAMAKKLSSHITALLDNKKQPRVSLKHLTLDNVIFT